MSAKDVAEAILNTVSNVLNLASAVGTFVPGAAQPLHVAEVLVKDADDVFHRVTALGVEKVERRETEAGQSISKASHLAGLREAIDRALMGVGHSVPGVALDAIMAEVARRMP
jgi:hypothetical protein